MVDSRDVGMRADCGEGRATGLPGSSTVSPRIVPAGAGGQIVAVAGGPVAAVNAVCQSWAQGQSRGRCRTRRRPVAAIRAGTFLSMLRTLAHLALARPRSPSPSTARATLKANAGPATQGAGG